MINLNENKKVKDEIVSVKQVVKYEERYIALQRQPGDYYIRSISLNISQRDTWLRRIHKLERYIRKK